MVINTTKGSIRVSKLNVFHDFVNEVLLPCRAKVHERNKKLTQNYE
jgi:hypothetical protein